MDGSAALQMAEPVRVCWNAAVAKHCCCSARSVLLAWPQAASSQLLCADAITFPLWSWTGLERAEQRDESHCFGAGGAACKGFPN